MFLVDGNKGKWEGPVMKRCIREGIRRLEMPEKQTMARLQKRGRSERGQHK